jgi:hypothetical protein
MASLEEFFEYTGEVYSRDLFEKTFLEFSSDKSGYHNYHLIYERLFPEVDKISNVLEMGIHLGSSLRAWKKIFSEANIIGLENNIDRFFTEARILSMYVDQSILQTFDNFKSLMRGTEFDFIIDDGSHYLQETKNTFYNLLPSLKVGGWFVIEDIRWDFEQNWADIANNLGSNYKAFLINMTDMVQTTSNDNIVLAIKRIS